MGDVSYEINTVIAQPYLIGIGAGAIAAVITITSLIGAGIANAELILENISEASRRVVTSIGSSMKKHTMKLAKTSAVTPEVTVDVIAPLANRTDRVKIASKAANHTVAQTGSDTLPLIVVTKDTIRNLSKNKTPRTCPCGKIFKPMTDAQWNHVLRMHTKSAKHKENITVESNELHESLRNAREATTTLLKKSETWATAEAIS